jgi:hypothetical protein
MKTLNKRISTLAISIFILIAPMTLGVHPMVPMDNTALPEIMSTAKARLKPVMLAENKKSAAGNNAQTTAGADGPEKEPESGPEADNKDPSAKSETAPLKSFKPSEEIAAEQAVDFPVDI